MATLVLQAIGASLGGALGIGGIGAALGQAAGALGGYLVDRSLIQSTRHIEGPRLAGARPFSAEEGAPIPRLYGTARLGGIMIWATRFEEAARTERQGFKGGERITEYSYFGNVAFALCEGEIAGIRRVWADGREIDRETIEMRLHTGSEDQPADPLILAKQGAGNAPAYRGIAYVVIERLPLGTYGNRIPQFQFEVMRPVGSINRKVRSVTLIPGSTEYGLSPGLVTQEIRKGETVALNRNVLHAATDLAASLDELQALCPNLAHVALVVTWFGDDLRAGHCRIRPAVTDNEVPAVSAAWRVSGLTRATAPEVSRHQGNAAYGGTPSDRSVMDAIAEIKARGLKVTLYPFVMMDVPAGNALPDPHGGAVQAAYPWRGRIACYPGPGQPASADKTAAARTQVGAFCGAAASPHFSFAGDTIAFSGSADDWGYRRLVLHYAHLATVAGGVDAFLIGSELRGLTTLRDGAGKFPFVEALCQLAADVRAALTPGTKISYGADWSEYFGHQPADGSGDVLFHLDPLWAHEAIDAIGIDNYMPLADWRDEDRLGANPDGFAHPGDPAGLSRAVAGGEGFDWYYPDETERALRLRSPIADGAYGKHWVFRYKDLAGWWSNLHYDRIGGVEKTAPTAWVPQMKPIWLTELGCPAADKGANQPNVFPDAKSSESAAPYFSNGGRSDAMQRGFIDAHLRHWTPGEPGFEAAANPVSPVYGGRMVDPERIYLWAWDARPYPAFPLRRDIWGDTPNWQLGHWLNGRLEGAPVGEVINAILADHGLPPAIVDELEATIHGFVVGDPASAREALEGVADLFGLALCEGAQGMALRSLAARGGAAPMLDELVVEEGRPVAERVRVPDHDLPAEGILSFIDPFNEYQAATVRLKRPGVTGARQQTVGFSGVMEEGQARGLLEDWMQRRWSARETASFSLAGIGADTAPGSVVTVPAAGEGSYLVTEVEDGAVRRVAARRLAALVPSPWTPTLAPVPASVRGVLAGPPLALLLDLPMLTDAALPADQFRAAVWQRPWKTQQLYASPETTGYALRASLSRPAMIGRLLAPLVPGSPGRIDRSGSIEVELAAGELAGISELQMLNGGNAAAVQSSTGVWEIVQFAGAEEVAADAWRLTDLLRGQLGTSDAAAAGADEGAWFVLLDSAVAPAGLKASEAGLALNWRIGPSGTDFGGPTFATLSAAGGLRALTPLAPVHLEAQAQGGDLAVNWIRCGRVDADGWDAAEIPLGEPVESYLVEVLGAGGAVVRSETVGEPSWRYFAAAIAADFPDPPASLTIRVRQRGGSVNWGLPAFCETVLP